jgi:hypothetical protein
MLTTSLNARRLRPQPTGVDHANRGRPATVRAGAVSGRGRYGMQRQSQPLCLKTRYKPTLVANINATASG